MPLTDESIEVIIKGLFEFIKAVAPKDKLEKIENEWKKDLPKLIECVKSGDIDCYSAIVAKYKHQL